MNNSTNQKAISLKSLKKYVIISVVLLVSIVAFNVYIFNNIQVLDAKYNEKYNEIHRTIKKSQEANEKVLVCLEEIRDEQKKLEQHQQQILQLKTEQKYTIMRLKSEGLSPYTDLGENCNISVEDMNAIIDYYDSMIKGGTPFKNKGEVFINASKKSGLNPVYIFAHASCESGFGTSYLARTRGNYFGINAVDANPDLAYKMGDSVEEGITAGAMWIKKNYYDNGYCTIQDMKSAGYATSDTWVSEIINIANGALNEI